MNGAYLEPHTEVAGHKERVRGGERAQWGSVGSEKREASKGQCSVIRPAVPANWQLLTLGSSLPHMLESGLYLQGLPATRSKFIVSHEPPQAGIPRGGVTLRMRP